MIKKFSDFTNESVRDRMTPKSDEEILDVLSQIPIYDRIVKECELGLLDLVKKDVESGEEVGLNRFVNRPINAAVNAGHYDVVEYLISMGSDVHRDEDHLLRQACHYGYTDIVRLLLDNGADIHSIRDYSLQTASQNGHIDTVKFLVDRGATISANNNIAFYVACFYDRYDVAKYLFEKGARPTHKNFREFVRVSNDKFTPRIRELIDPYLK